MIKNIFKSFSYYGIEVFGLALMLISASFLSKTLSLSDYGIYATIALFLSWLEFFISGGMGKVVLVKISEKSKKLNTAREMLQTFFFMAFMVCLLLILSLLVWNYFNPITYFFPILISMAIYIFATAFNIAFRQISFMLLSFKEILIQTFIKHLSRFILIICITTYYPFYISCIVAISASTLFTFFYNYKNLGYLFKIEFNNHIFKYLSFAAPIFIASISLRIYDILDIYLIEYFRGAKQAAIYSSAHSIKVLVSLIGSTSTSILIKEYSELLKKNDITKIKTNILNFVFIGILLSLFLYPADVVLKWGLKVVYPPSFLEAQEYTFYLLFGVYILIFNNVLQIFLFIKQKLHWIMYLNISVLISGFIAYYILLSQSYSIIYITYSFIYINVLSLFITIILLIKEYWIQDLKIHVFIDTIFILMKFRIQAQFLQFKSLILSQWDNPHKGKSFQIIVHKSQNNNFSQWIKYFPYHIEIIALEELNAENNYSNLMITSSGQLEILNKYKLLKNKNIFIPNQAIYDLCMDKFAFRETFINTEFECYFPKFSNEQFPYVVKKKLDEPRLNTHLIENQNDELKHKEYILNENYFCQEYIIGDKEYSFHSLIINNQIVDYVCFEFKYDTFTPISYNSKLLYKRKVNIKEEYVLLFKKMLNYISYQGINCLDFKIKDNKVYIFEVNPRMGYNLRPYFHTFISKIK